LEGVSPSRRRQSQTPAKRKFIGAVRSGADPSAIISAAESYASEEAAKDRVGTPYIAQAVTWLNQRRWEDFAPGESPSPVMGPPEPPMPGLRSREELSHRYGIKRREIERTSPESPSILAEGVGIRDEKQTDWFLVQEKTEQHHAWARYFRLMGWEHGA